MLQTNWLRLLSSRSRGRGARAPAQVGLYRSSSHMFAARVRLDSDSCSVEQLETVDCTNQRDEQAAVQLLRTGIFREAPAILVLGAEHYSTHPLPAPAVPPAELREALRWKLRDVLPYGPEEAVVDFVRLANAPEANAAESLFVVAARRRSVAQAVAPLQAVNIDLQAVDIGEMAQRNLLNRLPGSEAVRALLGLDESSALLTIVHERALCFARRIQTAPSEETEDEDPEHLAARIATHVQRSLEVVERQSGLAPMRTLWVGPHPYCALITRCIAEHAFLECLQLDIQAELQFAATVPKLPSVLGYGALIAIGAALRTEQPAAANPPVSENPALSGYPS
jgi:MSHA biogenesis protein MshI